MKAYVGIIKDCSELQRLKMPLLIVTRVVGNTTLISDLESKIEVTTEHLKLSKNNILKNDSDQKRQRCPNS